MVTPNLPEAICFVADLADISPSAVVYLLSSSPPSPLLDFPPTKFMAIAKVVCASYDIDPKDIAPVTNLFKIFSTGSTSSIGIDTLCLNSSKLRRVIAPLSL